MICYLTNVHMLAVTFILTTLASHLSKPQPTTPGITIDLELSDATNLWQSTGPFRPTKSKWYANESLINLVLSERHSSKFISCRNIKFTELFYFSKQDQQGDKLINNIADGRSKSTLNSKRFASFYKDTQAWVNSFWFHACVHKTSKIKANIFVWIQPPAFIKTHRGTQNGRTNLDE